MHDTLARPSAKKAASLSVEQEFAVLNALNESIFITVPEHFNWHERPCFNLQFVNKQLAKLFEVAADEMTGRPLTSIFPVEDFRILHDALVQATTMKDRQEIEITLKTTSEQKRFSVSLTAQRGADKSTRVIGALTDITSLVSRTAYLEDRAVRLIDHANGLETSRRDLEKEVAELRKSIRSLERSAKFDKVSGLPNRAHFFERAAAEFQRSLRYDHPLSLVVADVQGYAQVVEKHGEKSGDLIMTSLGQLCETAYRGGADIAGRVSDSEIAVLLPETALSGALQFVDRLRTLVAATPIQLDDGIVRPGIRTGIDAIQSEDHSIAQALGRAQAALSMG